MNTNDIIINCSNIKFCPGPCNLKTIEQKPIKIENKYWYNFKPHSGGRYDEISYPFNNTMLKLKNVRLCRSCNKRNLEFWDEQSYENLENDASVIIKKLNINPYIDIEISEILDGPAFNTKSLSEAILDKEEAKKYNSEDEKYLNEYVEFIRPFDYDHRLEAGVDIKE